MGRGEGASIRPSALSGRRAESNALGAIALLTNRQGQVTVADVAKATRATDEEARSFLEGLQERGQVKIDGELVSLSDDGAGLGVLR